MNKCLLEDLMQKLINVQRQDKITYSFTLFSISETKNGNLFVVSHYPNDSFYFTDPGKYPISTIIEGLLIHKFPQKSSKNLQQ